MLLECHLQPKIPLSGVLAALCWLPLPCLVFAQELNLAERATSRVVEDRLLHLWELDPHLGVQWESSASIQTNRPDADANDPQPIGAVFPENAALSLKAVHSLISRASQLSHTDRSAAQQAIRRRLAAGNGNPQLEFALLSALIAVSDESIADELWNQYGNRPGTRVIVEEALVNWKSKVALETWRNRIGTAHTPLADLLLALRGLEAVGDSSDRQRLESLVAAEDCPLSMRVLAARVLGSIETEGLEPLARRFLSSSGEHCELVAAYLLSGHQSQQAVDTLVELLHSGHEPAQRLALRALANSAPQQAEANFEMLTQHPDPEIRIFCVEMPNEAYDNERLWQVAGLMGDPHSQVRVAARKCLSRAFSHLAFKREVSEIIRTQLASDSTLAKEQAIRLSVDLNQSQFCHRFIDLQTHPEPRVFVTAAWALQQLLEDPQYIDLVRLRATEMSETHFQGSKLTADQGAQLAFLLEVMGKHGVQEAKSLLERFIPKYCAPDVTRASAIWALGKLWEKSENGSLAIQLAQRMHDDNENYPEHDLVKFSCALALGRIQHPDSRNELEKHAERPPYPIGLARQWALSRF